jgi:diguanylate cyclase (GGDEF)-like protein/PAS domain S-box-containing protein
VERLGPVVRLSLGLVILTSSVLVLVDLVGLVPDASNVVVESRIRLSETLATQLTPAAERNDLFLIRKVLGVTVARNEDVLSGGLRAASGRLMVSAGDHRELWNPEDATRSSATHVRLPLFQSGKKWGTVELRFRGSGSTSLLIALWDRPLLRLVLAVAVLGFALYMLYMRRTLRHLDPSAVIPSRVQHALDVMTEGVLLLDEQERIVLANSAFAERLDRTPTSLLGVKASKLDWMPPDAQGARLQYPWLEAIRNARTSTGTALRIETKAGAPRSFAVNASPVLDGWERPKGAIVTFDDVTLLEQKTAALEAANIELEKSRDEIYFHAEEMEVLARRDPLTGVANRRAFMEMEWAEKELGAALVRGAPFSCLMSDIDHFKRINDTHGHPMGDDVIRRVAQLFADEVRGSDSVCRYGGEEFCIAFPGAAVDAAARVAERLREKVGAPGFAEVPVKMSFGVVSSESGATTLSELLDQADKALYASKEGGRDRVTRWEALPPEGSPSARDRAK